MENPGLTTSPCEILNPATLLPTPEDCLPFHSCLETLRGIVRRPSDQSWGNLVHWWKQLCLGWKKKSWICSSLQCWDHRGQTFATRNFSPISWAHGPDSSLELGKGKRVAIYRLLLCLPGATCTCCCLERKRPLDHLRVPNQIWWSNP